MIPVMFQHSLVSAGSGALVGALAFGFTGAGTLNAGIAAGLTSSAGVFDSGGALVRTLWNVEVDHPNVNNPTAAWDGTVEDGTVAPTGSYVIKVLAHNCTYTWEGVIGNTSPDHTNLNYWNEACPTVDMEIDPSGKMWYTSYRHERLPTIGVSSTSNIQVAEYAVPIAFRTSYAAMLWATTDGTRTYFSNWETGNYTTVVVVDCATKQFVHFPGVGVGWWGIPDVALAVETVDPDFWISSIAVQRSANYLFICRPSQNKLISLNKTTGVIAQSNTTSFVEPTLVECNPVTNDVWLYHQVAGVFRITKCTVDGSGNVTATGVAITTLFQSLRSIAISPDGSTLLAADGGSSQQVKAFNTSDGSVKSAFGTSGAFGTAGGYAVDPTVTSTKFMFENRAHFGGGNGWVAYAPDGSWWLGDSGNNRHLHFTSGNSPTFIEQVLYQPIAYACGVCRGDPTRVFIGYLEFSVNYSLPLSPTNGSWTLVRNWGHISSPDADPTGRLRYVGVYSNGRTYASVHDGTAPVWLELDPVNGLRNTGVHHDSYSYIDEDMNAYFTNWGGYGNPSTIAINPFTGFDGSNNPTWQYPTNWSAFDIYLTTQPIPTGFTQLHHGGVPWVHVEATENNIIPIFDVDGSRGYVEGVGWSRTSHFGGIHATTGAPMFSVWHTHANNHNAVAGQNFLLYPEIAFWATHGTWSNAGGVFVYEPGEPHIFMNNIGEGGWGNNQTNIWMHFHDSGLLVQRFGVAAPYFASTSLTFPEIWTDNIPSSFSSFKAMDQMAGNSKWGGYARVGDAVYLYQNDEWYHSGLHRWKVEGLDEVIVNSTNVSWDSSSYVPPSPNPNDLLEGLPFDTLNLANGTAGWTRFPLADITTSQQSGPWLRILTNAIVCDPRSSPDIALSVHLNNSASPSFVEKALPRVGVGNWTVTSKVFLYTGWDDWDASVKAWVSFDILDNTGKIIFTIHNFRNNDAVTDGCKINGIDLFTPVSPAGKWMNKSEREVPLIIAANVGAGTMSVTYEEFNVSRTVFEVGANLASPAKVRLYHTASTNGESYFQGGCITELLYSES